MYPAWDWIIEQSYSAGERGDNSFGSWFTYCYTLAAGIVLCQAMSNTRVHTGARLPYMMFILCAARPWNSNWPRVLQLWIHIVLKSCLWHQIVESTERCQQKPLLEVLGAHKFLTDLNIEILDLKISDTGYVLERCKKEMNLRVWRMQVLQGLT